MWSLPTIAKAGDAATPLGKRGCDFLPNRKFISRMGVCRESSRTYLQKQTTREEPCPVLCPGGNALARAGRVRSGAEDPLGERCSTLCRRRTSSCQTLPGPWDPRRDRRGPSQDLHDVAPGEAMFISVIGSKGEFGSFLPTGSPDFGVNTSALGNQALEISKTPQITPACLSRGRTLSAHLQNGSRKDPAPSYRGRR